MKSAGVDIIPRYVAYSYEERFVDLDAAVISPCTTTFSITRTTSASFPNDTPRKACRLSTPTLVSRSSMKVF